MGEVVEFPPEDELGYWLCDCGCQTHYVRTDGEVECAHCGNLVSNAGGGYLRVPEYEAFIEKPDEVNHVVMLDSAETAIRRVLRRQEPDNMCALIVLWANGKISTWGKEIMETRAQRGWLRRGLECARRVLVE